MEIVFGVAGGATYPIDLSLIWNLQTVVIRTISDQRFLLYLKHPGDRASTQVQAQDINIAAHLQVEGPVAPGGETRIAIRFTPRSNEWHGYWSNPGDAGLGMQVEWQLPEGVSVGEFRYPPPKTLLIGGLMNHVFEGDYAVIAPLRVAKDAPIDAPFELRGVANYLACTDKICVPQRADLCADRRDVEGARHGSCPSLAGSAIWVMPGAAAISSTRLSTVSMR